MGSAVYTTLFSIATIKTIVSSQITDANQVLELGYERDGPCH